MSHHAQIDENNKVIQVLVTNSDDPNVESFLVETFGGTWLQTSYNSNSGIHYDSVTGEPDDGTHIRYNFAGIGYTYDPDGDAFHTSEGPYPSWTLDKSTYTWVAPIPKPMDVVSYWNEEEQNWYITPSPYPSWKCVNNVWVAPISKPIKGSWDWEEESQTWYLSNPLAKDTHD